MHAGDMPEVVSRLLVPSRGAAIEPEHEGCAGKQDDDQNQGSSHSISFSRFGNWRAIH
jgi:hypothetical protein